MATKVRDWLNQNSAVTTIGAVVIIIICLVILLWNAGVVGGPSYHRTAYYYDIQTHKLFVSKIGQMAPIKSPSGANNGVLAHVFSCTDCSDQSSRFIGWLERYTPKAKKRAQMAKKIEKKRQDWIKAHPDAKTPPPGPDPMALMMGGPGSTVVRLPKEGAKWVSPMSKAGNAIMSRTISKKCGADQKIKRCYP